MAIPSNFTLEETLKSLPRTVEVVIIESKLEKFYGEMEQLRGRLLREIKDAEVIDEQNCFASTLIEEISTLCKQPGGKIQLVKAIHLAIENTSFEM